jgi:NAD-dependent DNA ligase
MSKSNFFQEEIKKLISPSKVKEYCYLNTADKLYQMKLYLDDLYYNTDSPAISDELYDILDNYLKNKQPNRFFPIGAKIRSRENRVNIPYYMGSVDKITPNEGKSFSRWIVKNPSKSHIVTSKLDGVSGLFVYRNGRAKLYTRGDGTIGSDISFLIPYLSFPSIKNKNISVRGELIIEKEVFHKLYSQKYKNARNMVSGLVGSKTLRDGIKSLQFIAFEIVSNDTCKTAAIQLKKLRKYGFRTVNYIKVKPAIKDISELISLHNTFKNKSLFEIDGIVVQSNNEYDRNRDGNPSYMFAFKMRSKDNIAITTVEDIEWSITRWGQLIPVAIIKPVNLVGCSISRVSLSNAAKMKDLKIGPGAIVEVTRSNDVIPFILNVRKESDQLKMPFMDYKWDSNNVHLQINKPVKKTKDEIEIKAISSFFSKMGIKHVSTATVGNLYKNGYNSILKIVTASKEDLVQIPRIKEKSAIRIVQNIRNGLKSTDIFKVIGCSATLGYGIGLKRIQVLLHQIPDLLHRQKKDLTKDIEKIDGFSHKIAQKIVNNLENAKKFFEEIKPYCAFTTNKRISDSLKGKKFVFTGFRSKDLEQEISNRGGKIVGSISKNTTALIIKSSETKTGKKIEKSQKLKVPILDIEQFRKKFI